MPKDPLVDADKFAEIKNFALELPLILLTAMDSYARTAHKPALIAEYQELKSDTLSSAGLFGALPNMTPQMVGHVETAWFQKLAKFSRRIMNSMVDKPLDDTSAFANEQMDALPIDALINFSKLNTIVSAINNTFPPPGRTAAL